MQWGPGSTQLGVSHLRALEYDAYEQISAINNLTYPEQNETYAYDALGHLEAVQAEYGRIAYDYDAAGNRTGQLFERKKNTPTGGIEYAEYYSELYQYNAGTNRLASVTRSRDGTSLRVRNLGYDARGNIKTETRTPYNNGVAGDSKTYQLNYGNSDRLDGITVPAP